MNPLEEDILLLTQREPGKRGRKKKEGFFTKKEKPEKPKQEKKLAAPKKKKEYGCELCGLDKTANSPRMRYTGEGRLKVLAIAEAPGKWEDEKGIQLIGDAGKLLRTHLRSNGFDLDKDFWKTNCVVCRPTNDQGGNRTPTETEIKCCRPQWQQEVKELNPSHIFLMGESAVKAFFGERGKKIKENLSISRWRKLCVPDPWSKAWVTGFFHPSFVLRNPDAEYVFARDLKWALGNLRKAPPEFPDWRSRVEMITDYREVIQFISRLYEEPELAIDYETNRLRPYAPGSEVVSVGVGLSGKGVSFPMTHPESGWSSWEIEEVKTCWASFIRNYSGKLLVHNHQMERIWTKRFFGVDAQNWAWDSMVVAHILDERQQYTSLDFQVFIHWGFEYGTDIDSYKQSTDKENDESFNRMKEAPLSDLLQYNGLDAMFTHKLKQQQAFEVERNSSLKPAVNLFLAGIRRFADMEDLGIRVDNRYYQEKDKELGETVDELEKKLNTSEEATIFEKTTGKPLKWSSTSKDLPVLLYDILKEEAKVFTPKGKPSAKKEVIQEIKGEFFENLRQIRKLKKLKNTHLKAFLRSIDGKLHPSLTLHIPRSYRSASQNPNAHNLDKHDENSMRLIRGGVIPSPGRQIGAVDYGSHEVRIFACLSGDKQLQKDLLEGMDFHAYFGGRLGVSRFDGKNSFVFAKIYGSWYKPIWEDLRTKGYTDLNIELVKEVEEEFEERYHGGREWQKKIIKDYQVKGYVEMPWGFKRRGYLERNKIINCVDEKTKCLTARGWLRYDEIQKSDNILTLNPNTLEYEWQAPLEIHVYPTYTGEMYELNGKSISALTTPNHRWFVKVDNNPKTRFVESKDISIHGDHRIFRVGNYRKKINEEGEYSDDFIKLIGWFVTDGSFRKNAKKKDGSKTIQGISICQSLRANFEKAIKIKEILGRLEIPFSYSFNKITESVTFILSKKHSIVSQIVSMFPRRMLTYEFIFGLSKEQANMLIDTMILGDGCVDGKWVRLSCENEEEADLFQALCVVGGNATHAKERDFSKYIPTSKKMLNIPNSKTSWNVSILRRAYAQIQKHNYNKIPFSGLVWCPTVPNGTFVAKRDGTTYITGNSPIQGAAFHCLLWSLIKSFEKKEKRGWESDLFLEIHDEMLFDLIPGESKEIQYEITKTMIEEIREENSWITIPLVSEWTIGKIDAPWSKIKEK